ncbi:right-handed parallel beta-helix repeat-containing protein [Rhizobium laguerreae]|uniref:right-handed parallel beta-helix repeat-containing protein n=1 Tax=Rhizobium laguerreae TaxID=1076926 RepID=UPI001C905A5B|nr:right-handed parallel beta-helix repeat-containing protein [Rhizobium laguerreae]MBY3138982.1 right-handed parallel beta-helix repeat-containing protein [Rhizobium laguerreae]
MQRRVIVDRSTVQDALRRAIAGDVISLSPGHYPDRLVISGKSGSPSEPIIIYGPGAAIGPKISFEDYRVEGNSLSKRMEDEGKFPGLYYLADNAALIVRDCQWIILEDLRFDGCWPTAVYFDNCQNVIVRSVHFRGGTFAIGATGGNTRHMLVEGCSWIQDTSGKGEIDLASIVKNGHPDPNPPPPQTELWSKTLWTQIHGAAKDGFPVKDTDARAFDGDFFRAWTIAGYVVIRKNIVIDAFNAVHMFNEAAADRVQAYCKNVLIEDNWFVRIRDNAVEPENHAFNWTVRHNKFVDCYMPFSFEMVSSGHFYVYGNLGWNANKPGPLKDDHAAGQLFKFPDTREVYGPHYVFNNTWLTRMAVAKKKRFAGFHHFNNAIALREPNGAPAVDPPNVFGSQWASPDKPDLSPEDLIVSEEKRFTKRWDALKIEFDGDQIEHSNFPAAYRGASYPLGANSRGGQLKLAGHTIGVPDQLHLDRPPQAIVRDIVLANGQTILSGDGSTDIGAWQTYGLFTLGACAFEDLWPGEPFAKLSGTDSDAPVA